MLLSSIAISSILLASSVQSPESKLVVAPCDVGEHWQFEEPSCDFQLTNTGDKPIRVFDIKGALAWDKGGEDVVVPPHGVAYAKATVDLRDSLGQVKRTFRFRTSEPGVLAERGSSVYAFVVSAIDQAPLHVDFGATKLSENRPESSITLSSREVPNFKILGVISKPDYLDVKLGEDGKTLTVKLGSDSPWGLLHDKIKVKTNVPKQPEAWVTVEANVIGKVAPSGNPYSFGLMRTNNKNTFLVRLTSDDGKDFKVGKTSLVGVSGDVRPLACKPKREGCLDLKVTVSNKQTRGRLQGNIEVELPDYHRTLPIQVVGMLLEPDFKVVDFNEEAAKGAAAQSSVEPESNGSSSQLDIGSTLKDAVKSEVAPPPGRGPLLRWSVANERSVYGYVVYRSDTKDGNYLKINKGVILVADRGSAVGEYQWRDVTAVPGNVYWYSIDMIKGDGVRESLVSAQEVVSK